MAPISPRIHTNSKKENSPPKSDMEADLKSINSSKDDIVPSAAGKLQPEGEEDSHKGKIRCCFPFKRKLLSYMSKLKNFVWKSTPERKPSYCAGIDAWVSSDPEEIIEVPEEQQAAYKRAYPLVGANLDRDGCFQVICDAEAHIDFSEPSTSAGPQRDQEADPTQGSSSKMNKSLTKKSEEDSGEDSGTHLHELCDPPKPPLYHLVFRTQNDENHKKLLSLFRSRRVTDVIASCERCRECCGLFDIHPKGKKKHDYYAELLSMLKKNVLWKSGHIAAAMGIEEYFSTGKLEVRAGLNVPCQPELQTPILIAVENNRTDLVSKMLTLDPDLTAVDVNKNNVLHLAAGSSAKMIKILMETGKCDDLLNVANASGSSPLYVAISSANAYCAKKLQHYGASLKSVTPATSNNPIVDAMRKDKLDVNYMRSILEANPEALEEIDSITGNSVLHNAKYKKPLLALLQLKANDFSLEKKNSQNQTALHVYVLRNDLPMVIALAAYDADVNAQDGNGNSPLHMAVSNNNLDITRLLLCLGADPNLANKQNETPRHLAAKMLKVDDETGLEIIKSLIICNAEPCPKGFPGCTVACVHKDNFVNEPKVESPSRSSKKSDSGDDLSQVDPKAPTAMYEFNLDPDSQGPANDHEKPNPIRSFPQEEAIERVTKAIKEKRKNVISVLAMDGGGIKGLVTVQILLALEKLLDEPLLNYFDWVAGTSTGSYIGGALCTGCSLRAMQRKYLCFKDALFDTWARPYSAEILEGFLQEMFGEETALSNVNYPKLFFTTVRADQFPVQLDLLRSYTLPVAREQNDELGFEDPADLKMWRAARRSSAAPTYFPSSEGKYIDGGMVANNPTSDLLTEICFWNSVCRYVDPKSQHIVDVGCVLSVGTGITPITPVDPKLFEMSDMFGLLRGLKNLTSVVLDTATATEGAPIARSRTWCHSLGMPYYRLNAPLSKDVMLDSKEEPELVKMMWEAVVYSFTHRKDFEELAALLKTIGPHHERKKILPLAKDMS